MRTCRVCKETKKLNSVNFKPVRKIYFSHECRKCFNKRCNLYYINKKTKPRNNHKRTLSRYNLTEKEYLDLVNKFNNKCWICKDREGSCIDHDHSCCNKKSISCGNCVRGWLCISCNNAIGLLNDRIDLLESAVQYILRGHSKPWDG